MNVSASNRRLQICCFFPALQCMKAENIRPLLFPAIPEHDHQTWINGHHWTSGTRKIISRRCTVVHSNTRRLGWNSGQKLRVYLDTRWANLRVATNMGFLLSHSKSHADLRQQTVGGPSHYPTATIWSPCLHRHLTTYKQVSHGGFLKCRLLRIFGSPLYG